MSTRPITDTLRQIGGGTFLDRISEQAAQCVLHAQEQGKKATLKIEISVRPANRGGAVIVTGQSVVNLPKPAPEDALLWATPDGNLVTSNPNQKSLDLRSVDAETGEIRIVAGG
jgi:hypothetical protein